jgi:diadenosine tetraphosphate (Ap4A) HIT family hydrolase
MSNLAKTLPPRNWRTAAMHATYEKGRGSDLGADRCPFCHEIPETKFNYWFIKPNKYPYDGVALKHDLLMPYRHVADFDDLSEAELRELSELKSTILNESYTFLIEAMNKNKSIPGHFHFHLIEPKVIN